MTAGGNRSQMSSSISCKRQSNASLTKHDLNPPPNFSLTEVNGLSKLKRQYEEPPAIKGDDVMATVESISKTARFQKDVAMLMAVPPNLMLVDTKPLFMEQCEHIDVENCSDDDNVACSEMSAFFQQCLDEDLALIEDEALKLKIRQIRMKQNKEMGKVLKRIENTNKKQIAKEASSKEGLELQVKNLSSELSKQKEELNNITRRLMERERQNEEMGRLFTQILVNSSSPPINSFINPLTAFGSSSYIMTPPDEPSVIEELLAKQQNALNLTQAKSQIPSPTVQLTQDEINAAMTLASASLYT